MKKKMVIFSPGPANISERVRKSLLKSDICHRDIEFSCLLRDVRRLINRVCGVVSGYESVVFTGSGTAAIEACLASLKGISKRLLIISNGVYGERAFEIASINHLRVRKISFRDNVLPDLNKIELAIKKYRVDALYIVHHETTSGLLNPLKEIGGLAEKHKLLLIVDGVSSIAGEELKLKKWGVDVIIGSANKCIRGVAGLSFALLSKRFIEKIKRKHLKNSYYLALDAYLAREKKDETPFTPAVHNFYAFHEALRELLQEGADKRIAHYKKISFMIRQGLRKRGFKIYVDDKISSNTMTTILLPLGINYKWLHKKCKEKGYCLYAAMGKLKDKAFRMGVVGLINKSDIRGFFKVLDKILAERKNKL
jgi:2-aminoethylphosphonate-pyruvate transaminase